MDKQEFSEIIGRGREQPGVEFKGGGSRKDKRLLAKVIRAVMGMANRRDGGRVIIGVQEDEGGAPIFNGVSPEDLLTWSYDDLADSLAQYVDPSVNFDLETVEYEGKTFVAILVHEFEDIPVLCKKDYPDVLRAGACYVRTRRKPETLEVPTQADMRDLLELAIDKGIRKFVTRARAGRLDLSGQLPPTDGDLFNEQIKDLLRGNK
jgi:predicted HTH transcriptional regulator